MRYATSFFINWVRKQLYGRRLRALSEAEVIPKAISEIERTATQRAKDRANAGMWNLDIAVFLFAVLIIIIILLFEGIGIEIVAPVAVFSLAMVWLVGRRQGKQLYQRFYHEELARLEGELKGTDKEIIEETVKEIIYKTLRERWR